MRRSLFVDESFDCSIRRGLEISHSVLRAGVHDGLFGP